MEVALSYNNIKFYISSNEVLTNASQSNSSIVIFKYFDEKINIYEGNYEVNNILKFIESHMFPIVIPLNKDHYLEEVSDKHRMSIILFKSKNSQISEELDLLYKNLAKKYKENLSFFISYLDTSSERKLAEFFTFQEESLPRIGVVHFNNESTFYRFPYKTITEENLSLFLDELIERKIPRYFKSEEIPIGNSGPIIKIVGDSWNDWVIKNNKEVLVYFYAPWCYKCKEFNQTYFDLAECFLENKNIVISEIDATHNFIDGIQIVKYPSIKFYKASDKSLPIEYEGNFSFDNLMEFLELNSHSIHNNEYYRQIPDL